MPVSVGTAQARTLDEILADGGTAVLDEVLLGAGQHQVLVAGAVGQTGAYTLEIGGGCPELEASAGQTYGIFVGVSDYGGRATDLPRTADDARRLAGTLVDAGVLPATNANRSHRPGSHRRGA